MLGYGVKLGNWTMSSKARDRCNYIVSLEMML
jgi:hypothetical protein